MSDGYIKMGKITNRVVCLHVGGRE